MIINHGIYYIPRITKQRNSCFVPSRTRKKTITTLRTSNLYEVTKNSEFSSKKFTRIRAFVSVLPTRSHASLHLDSTSAAIHSLLSSSIHKSTDTHSDTDETTRKSSLSVEIPVRYFLLVSWTRGGGRRRGNASRLPLVCGLLEVRVLVDDGNVSNRGSARLPTFGRRHGRRGLRQKFRPGEGDHDCTGGGREQDG